jgi:CheY-like chemotaxis protein
MPLRILYPDKYRLWTEMVRGGVDRLFVTTEERPVIGARVDVDLMLPDLILPVTVEGVVVGRRGPSRRFSSGVYLRFDAAEIAKCRRFLGLDAAQEISYRARTSPRARAELPVRFHEPVGDASGVTANVSLTGLLVRTRLVLLQGQRVELTLTLDDGRDVETRCEVKWASAERQFVGLRFVDPAPDALRGCVERALANERPRPDGWRGSVVVADDDPDVLRLVTMALGKNGFEVHHTVVGYEALHLIREVHPDMAVVDILMPGIDGADICRILRADEELADIPVIFISALDEKQLHQVADEAGASDYLTKPVRLKELLEMVGSYLRL